MTRQSRGLRWVVTALLACGLTACSGDKQKVDPGKFAAKWQGSESRHFVIYLPPDSPRGTAALTAFGEACDQAFEQAAKSVELEVPQRLILYLFTTTQTCEAATGRPAGFVEGGNIYTRLGAPVGGIIAEAVCNAIDPGARSFSVIRRGIRVIFDHNEENVHARAAALRAAGRLPRLADLIQDRTIRDQEAYDFACASFVAYLIQRHGADLFKMLWRSVLELGPSLERIYGGTMDQVETDWLGVVEREASRT
jgi:hypothetical protein